MSSTCVIGLLWGDEGKGKLIDFLAAEAEYVVRFGGGHNAGHTLIRDLPGGPEKLVLHVIPSGVLREGSVNVIGNGVAVDPFHLRDEVKGLKDKDVAVNLGGNLLVSERSPLILPLHQAQDRWAEERRGNEKIGTTRRGIGPCYSDRATRSGLRVGDLIREASLRSAVQRLIREKRALFQGSSIEVPDSEKLCEQLLELGRYLSKSIVDTGRSLRAAHKAGKRILYEGAQGVLLDLEHGTYPYVTSSHASTGGIPSGTGVPPHTLDRVVGVVKAYATRVGEGPFPSEIDGEAADKLRTAGNEFGSTTGRPRRVGDFDTVAVRYACEVSGATELAVTNLDVLSGFDPLPMVVGYRLGKRDLSDFPAFDLDQVEVVREQMAGFTEDITGVRVFEELPTNAQAYIHTIEKACGVPVKTVSVGPGRDQVIQR